MIKRHEDYDAYLKQMGRYMRMAIKYEVAVRSDLVDDGEEDGKEVLKGVVGAALLGYNILSLIFLLGTVS